MTGEIVVVGLGNGFRRDDGVGVVAAAALADLALPDVRVVNGIVEPMSLLEAWSGTRLAVLIDAAVANPSVPGSIGRCTSHDLARASKGLSSHGIDVDRAHSLGQLLGRVPDALVVFTIEAGDTGHGVGLTPQVAAAVREVVEMAVAEINRSCRPERRSPRSASK